MDCTKVGNLIAQLRREKGMTQQQLAERLNISNKTVSKWECGVSQS
ncbi:MAG TPA: helix-turn-helix domain-containing protein [Candidatus Anaerofilum faecale]|nr:helix-turn-helix domain-containing protein [Candidatus Anaerofilum faecale]